MLGSDRLRKFRHPIYAFVVANNGLPSINGCPSRLLPGLMTKKCTGYSEKSTEIVMSSKVPSGLITDLSANSSRFEVGFKFVIPNTLYVL